MPKREKASQRVRMESPVRLVSPIWTSLRGKASTVPLTLGTQKMGIDPSRRVMLSPSMKTRRTRSEPGSMVVGWIGLEIW